MILHVGGNRYRVSQAGGGRLCVHEAVEFPLSVVNGASDRVVQGELTVDIDQSRERWTVEFERPSEPVTVVGARFQVVL